MKKMYALRKAGSEKYVTTVLYAEGEPYDVMFEYGTDRAMRFGTGDKALRFAEDMKDRFDVILVVKEVESLVSESETINHPTHYQSEKIEAIDVIEAFNLNFHLGNVVKYVLRAGKKTSRLEDLKKAKWYLDRDIEREEGK